MSHVRTLTMTVTEDTLQLDTPLAVRIYAAAPVRFDTPLVLHLHGGSFVYGSLDAGHTVSTLLAEAGAVVVSADYPLAPGTAFPKTLQILTKALNMLAQKRGKWAGKKSPLFVAGEEAGGNLAAALALIARDQRTPVLAGQILLSPMVDPSLATRSIREAEAGPVGCQWADGWHQYLGTADQACHPYAAPLGSSRLGGLAPALIVTAEDDPMRDESVAYAERLRASGVSVRHQVLPAPTGWPCALVDPDYSDGPVEGWTTKLREAFAQFLAGTASFLCPPPATHPIRA